MATKVLKQDNKYLVKYRRKGFNGQIDRYYVLNKEGGK